MGIVGEKDIFDIKWETELEILKEAMIEMLDTTFKEIDNREHGNSYFIKYNGERVTTDTGYAFDGIRLFIEEVKHKVGCK